MNGHLYRFKDGAWRDGNDNIFNWRDEDGSPLPVVNIDGVVYKRNNKGQYVSDGDAILILRLLHEAGFINPRLNDASKSRGFMHILFHDDPNFVKLENWNAMQAAKWEVHPAFRTYLMGIRDARLNRKKSSS